MEARIGMMRAGISTINKFNDSACMLTMEQCDASMSSIISMWRCKPPARPVGTVLYWVISSLFSYVSKGWAS